MWTRMRAHRAPSLWPGSATCRIIAIMRSSFRSTELNETSLSRLRISRALLGVPARSTGLIGTRIVSSEFSSRISGVMVGLPE